MTTAPMDANQPRKTVMVLGSLGNGKSTLLNVMSGQEED